MFEGTFQIRMVAATALWLAATLSTSGCLFQKKPRAYVPPPVRPTAAVVPDPPPAPLLDSAPEIETASVELPDLGPVTLPTLPPFVTQPATVRPRPVAAAPKPTPPPPDATPTLPRITQILTAQQSRDYNKEIDEELSRVTDALKKAAGRKNNLTTEQRDYVGRITAFQKQAVQAREEDLVTAVNYARRADLLATELLAHLP